MEGICLTKVKVGDINMYYEVHGEGEPLVMINGAGAGVEWLYRFIPTCSVRFQVPGPADKMKRG